MPKKQCPCRKNKYTLNSCYGEPDKTNQHYCLLEGDTFGKRCSDETHKNCYYPENE